MAWSSNKSRFSTYYFWIRSMILWCETPGQFVWWAALYLVCLTVSVSVPQGLPIGLVGTPSCQFAPVHICIMLWVIIGRLHTTSHLCTDRMDCGVSLSEETIMYFVTDRVIGLCNIASIHCVQCVVPILIHNCLLMWNFAISNMLLKYLTLCRF